jgi:hypothetical protein
MPVLKRFLAFALELGVLYGGIVLSLFFTALSVES